MSNNCSKFSNGYRCSSNDFHTKPTVEERKRVVLNNLKIVNDGYIAMRYLQDTYEDTIEYTSEIRDAIALLIEVLYEEVARNLGNYPRMGKGDHELFTLVAKFLRGHNRHLNDDE